ncbi:MAG: beta-N-acetylhexosaminidase [Ruminococcaceae bacterium]|nr:beta-N-acetylhexosaminidase [Oscillospiraceae bacterium]
MRFILKGDLDQLQEGVALLAPELGIELADGGYVLTAKRVEAPTLRVTLDGNALEIVYCERCQFFRAFGLAVEAMNDGKQSFCLEEKPAFRMNGPMFDMSQGNAAFHVKTLKDVIRSLALMGLNTLMLYTEDNYEVPGRPYFGYMRPTYTQKELSELDEYAWTLGIEMIPCIQTLAHMPDGLRWACFDDIRDYDACLLVGKEETYDFIRDLLVAASAPFRTKRIHVGLDEAWNLGRGKYIDQNGYEKPNAIMKKHLARVMELVRELGLTPMMWDDMFFRTAGQKYHDPYAPVPDDAYESLPKGMNCIYWDYYTVGQGEYEALLRKHLLLDKDLVFAGGCWAWRGFGLAWDHTLRSTLDALSACRACGVKDIFMTTWGDNGTESLATVNLIGCQLFAELGYADGYDRDRFARRFKFCTGGNLEDFENLQRLDLTDWIKSLNHPKRHHCNTSKIMMWQDILTGLADKNYENANLDAHYRALTPVLESAVGRNGRFDSLFAYSALVSHTLSMKSEMGLRLTAAYRAGDKEALRRFVEVELPELFERVKTQRLAHMENWMELYKPFGWDILDMRYGSLLARIDSAIREVRAYLDGKLETIEELDAERLYLDREGPYELNHYGRYVSPSRIDPRA